MRFFILTTSVVNAKRIFDNLNLNLSKKEIYTHLDFLNNLENEKQRKK